MREALSTTSCASVLSEERAKVWEEAAELLNTECNVAFDSLRTEEAQCFSYARDLLKEKAKAERERGRGK